MSAVIHVRQVGVATLAIAALGVVGADAATVRRAGGDGFWLDPGKWVLAASGVPTGHVPLVTEDIILDAPLTLDLSPNPAFGGPDIPIANSLLVQGVGGGVVKLIKDVLAVTGDVMVDGVTLNMTDSGSIGASALPGASLLIDNGGTVLIDADGAIDRDSVSLIGGTANRLTLSGMATMRLTGDTTVGVKSRVLVDGLGLVGAKARMIADLPGATGNLLVANSAGVIEFEVKNNGLASFAGTATIEGDVSVRDAGNLFTNTATVGGGGNVTVSGEVVFGGFPAPAGAKWSVGTGGLTISAPTAFATAGTVSVTNGGILDVAGNLSIAGGTTTRLLIDSSSPPVAARVGGEFSATQRAGLEILGGTMVVEGAATFTGGSFIVSRGASAILDVVSGITVTSSTLGDNETNLIGDMGIVSTSTFTLAQGNVVGTGALVADVVNNGRLYVGSSADGTSADLDINGSYTQTTSGELHLVLAGADFSTTDQLKVNFGSAMAPGPTTLAGTLSLHLDGSLVVSTGDIVDLVLSKTALIGTFSSVEFLSPDGPTSAAVVVPFGRSFRINYIRNAPDGIARVQMEILGPVPAPGPVVCLLGAGLIAGGRQRRR